MIKASAENEAESPAVTYKKNTQILIFNSTESNHKIYFLMRWLSLYVQVKESVQPLHMLYKCLEMSDFVKLAVEAWMF